MWLEAIYECERNWCLSYNDIEDMQEAIIHAEENLLKIGMPFIKDYKFHGKNAANKSRRNEKLRRMYKLTEKEEERTQHNNGVKSTVESSKEGKRLQDG